MRFIHILPLTLFLACVQAPKKAYTAAEISSITTIEEVMRVQAQQADPWFAKRSQDAFSDDEFASMVQVGDLLQATSAHLDGKFTGTGEYDDGFGTYAKELNQHAKSLSDAGAAKDAAKAKEALTSMKTTCSTCHGVYK